MRADIGYLCNTGSLSAEEKDQLVAKMAELGYKYTSFPETRCYHETFPIKKPAIIAFMLAPAKFYPALRAKIKGDQDLSKNLETAQGYGIMETYNDTEIEFWAPIEHIGSFYLTELPPPEKKTG